MGPVAGVWVRFWVGQEEAPIKTESTEREIRAFWGAEGGVGGGELVLWGFILCNLL